MPESLPEHDSDHDESRRGGGVADHSASAPTTDRVDATRGGEAIDTSQASLDAVRSVSVERDLQAELGALAESRPAMTGTALGVRRRGTDGLEMIDTLAGLVSSFGFGFEPIRQAVVAAVEAEDSDVAAGLGRLEPLGSDSTGSSQVGNSGADDAGGETHDDPELTTAFGEFVAAGCPAFACEFAATWTFATADEAFETAIAIARHACVQIAGNATQYKTVSLVGGDHGRTALCRAASGRTELQEGFGPLVAGFQHLPADAERIEKGIDESTAAVVIEPVMFGDRVTMVDEAVLRSARRRCDEVNAVLILDESNLAMASTGLPLAACHFPQIRPDAVLVSAGLTGGISGGVILAGPRFAELRHGLAKLAAGTTGIPGSATGRCPLVRAAARATVEAFVVESVDFGTLGDSMRRIAVKLAERIGGFEFIRDVQVSGSIIGIETDQNALEIVTAARRGGLNLGTAGESTVLMQLPAVTSAADAAAVIDRTGDVFERIERAQRAAADDA